MKSFFLAAVVLVMVTGCSSGISVQTEYDRERSFADYSTWNWRFEEAPASDDPRLNNPGLRDRIRLEVVRVMGEKGFTMDTENPDLLVQIQAHVDDRSFSRPNFGKEGMRETQQWADGVLSIGIRHGAENLLVWQGSADGRFEADMPREERLDQVDEMIDAILAKFPPK